MKMRIMSEDFLTKIAATIDEVTKQVDNKDKITYISKLCNSDAGDIVDKILTSLPDLILMLHDGNIFQ